MPLLRSSTVAELAATRADKGAAVAMLTALLDDPTGYGRVLRRRGRVERIVEEADATPAQRREHEVNTGVYAFAANWLREALGGVGDDNVQGERYLTDVVEIITGAGGKVVALIADSSEGMGVNDEEQLEAAARELRRRRTSA